MRHTLALLTLLAAACGADTEDGPMPGGPPLDAGTAVTWDRGTLDEVSGLARGALGWWHIEDSGHPPDLVLTAEDGSVQRRVRLAGATNRDWEELASGPCPSGRCLVVGDVGDNDRAREHVTLYRLPEPTGTTAGAERLDVRYPAGPVDVEAMVVDAAGDVWLLAKAIDVRVLRVPAAAWRDACPSARRAPCPQTTQAEEMPRLPLVVRTGSAKLTGATLSGDTLVALRTYDDVILAPWTPGAGPSLTAAVRCRLRGLQRQGEAVAWTADGRLRLASEASFPAPASFREVRCGRIADS